MSRSVHIGGLNSSASLAVSFAAVTEVELPQLPNGHFAKSYLFQQAPGSNTISFTVADTGASFAFGGGPLTPTNGTPLELDYRPGVAGTNRFVRARMATGSSTLVVTPLEK